MHRRQFLHALCATGLAALPVPSHAAPLSLDDIKAAGSLRVAVYRDFPPFSYVEHGQLKGIDIDLARALGQALGVAVSFMPLTPADDLDGDLRNAVWKGHYLGGGTADVMLHVPFDPALATRNPNAFLFGAYCTEQVAWAGQDVPEFAPALPADRLLGVETDTLADLYFSALQHGRVRGQLRHYPSTPAAARALLAGEVALASGPQSELEWVLAGKDIPLRPLTAPGLLKSRWEVGMATKEMLRDLAWALTDALEVLRQQGTLAKLFARHGVTFIPAEAH